MLVVAPASATTSTTYTVLATFSSVNFTQLDDAGVAPWPFPPFVVSSCDPDPAKDYYNGGDKDCNYWAEMYGQFSAATSAAGKGTTYPYRQVGKWGNGCFSSSGTTAYLYDHGTCPSIVDTKDYNDGGKPYPCWLDSIDRAFCTPGQSSPGRYSLASLEACRSKTKPSSTSPACTDPLYNQGNNVIDLAVHPGETINLSFEAYDYDNSSGDDLIQKESLSLTFSATELATLDTNRTLLSPNGATGGVQVNLKRIKTVFQNPDNWSIYDFSTINSPIVVSGQPVKQVPVTLGITIYHTFRGDLGIDLVAPDGTVYHLKSPDSDSADNYITTIGLMVTMMNGTWQLRVADVNAVDVGYLDSWSLSFS
jgi:hypothetical protein